MDLILAIFVIALIPATVVSLIMDYVFPPRKVNFHSTLLISKNSKYLFIGTVVVSILSLIWGLV